jgi:hypothetical protein
MKARSGMSLAATPLQPHSSSPIVFPSYRVKKKNTSNRGDDKKAAEKDSVQVSDGFTFDLAERHRTFFEYVRDKKWDSVASYLDRKSVLYSGRGSLYLNVCVNVRRQHSSCFYSR